MIATHVPAGIFPISAQSGRWHDVAPMPPVLREAAPVPSTDPANRLRNVTDAVMGNAPELRPFAKRADGRLLAGWEYPASTEAKNIGELALTK